MVKSFEERIKQSAWQFLLIHMAALFDIVTGHCGWVPATINAGNVNAVDVVVVSIPIMRWMVEFFRTGMYSSRHYNLDIRDMFVQKWKVMKKSEVVVDFKSKQFRDLIMQTPFKPAYLSKPSENAGKFFIARATDFRSFLELVETGSVSKIVLTPKQDRELMFFGEAYSVFGWNTKPRWLTGKGLSAQKRAKIPSMGVPWWNELLSDNVRTFVDESSLAGVKSFETIE